MKASNYSRIFLFHVDKLIALQLIYYLDKIVAIKSVQIHNATKQTGSTHL